MICRLAYFATLVLWCATNAAVADKPNILFILTDDQGWWDVGIRGNRVIDTPVLDRFARDGVDFTRFYAAPVCAPTRAGLMTGRYCFRTGLYNTRFGGDTLGLGPATEDDWQLFDLQSDLSEANDIAGKHPEVVRHLWAEFLRWFGDVTAGVEYRPVPIPVGHLDDSLVEIQASWAQWQGDNIEYVFRGYDWDTIEGWKEAGEQATWRLDVLRGGNYELAISYGRSARGGGTLKMTVGDQSIRYTPPPTPTADVFKRVPLGTLELSKGPAILKAEVVEAHGPELMRLNRVFLRKTN